MPRKKTGTSAATVPEKIVTYGEVMAKAQWDAKIAKERPVVPYYDLDGYPRKQTSDPYRDEAIKSGIVSRSSRRPFRFFALPLELQTEIVEWLEYADLKAFELVSTSGQRLGQHTQVLDTELFRKKLDLDGLKAAASGSLDEEVKIPVVLHPILDFRSLKLELSWRWSNVPFLYASLDWRRTKPCSMKNLKEVAENATRPPCSSVNFTLWGGEDWADHMFDNRPYPEERGKPFHFTAKAKSAGQPVTVEDLMKALLDAFEQIQYDMRDRTAGYPKGEKPIVFNPSFKGGFDTQYLDESGCLHLRDSRFRWPEFEPGSDDWY